MTSLEKQVFVSSAPPVDIMIEGNQVQATPCKLCGGDVGWLYLGKLKLHGWETEVDIVIAVTAKLPP